MHVSVCKVDDGLPLLNLKDRLFITRVKDQRKAGAKSVVIFESYITADSMMDPFFDSNYLRIVPIGQPY